MRVLMKIPETAEGLTGNALARACFGRFESKYYDNVKDDEIYLYEPEDEDFADAVDFVSGAENPETILETARGWNKAIQSDFDRMLDALRKAAPVVNGETQWLSAPSSAIYEFKKAAIALDGSMYDFAHSLLLINDNEYPTAVIGKDEMAQIEADPSGYAILSVWPK